jgi:AcrR family transcriptional regulator
VPKNRSKVDRVDKEREILSTAGVLALAEGPDAVTVSNIARQLGLARNAITWYFPTRDDLLAATFRHLATEAVSNPPSRTRLHTQLEWATEHLADLRPLYLYLGSRARHSPVAATAIRQTQDQLYAILRASLHERVPPEDVESTTNLLGVFVEGLLARPRTRKERASLIRSATTRLVPH